MKQAGNAAPSDLFERPMTPIREYEQAVYVYWLGPNLPTVKIGHTNDPDRRLAEFRRETGTPGHKADFAAIVWLDRRREAVERAAHHALRAQRRDGEWFAVSPEMALLAILRAAREMGIRHEVEDRAGLTEEVRLANLCLSICPWMGSEESLDAARAELARIAPATQTRVAFDVAYSNVEAQAHVWAQEHAAEAERLEATRLAEQDARAEADRVARTKQAVIDTAHAEWIDLVARVEKREEQIALAKKLTLWFAIAFAAYIIWDDRKAFSAETVLVAILIPLFASLWVYQFFKHLLTEWL